MEKGFETPLHKPGESVSLSSAKGLKTPSPYYALGSESVKRMSSAFGRSTVSAPCMACAAVWLRVRPMPRWESLVSLGD
jgi:hypothetical protein